MGRTPRDGARIRCGHARDHAGDGRRPRRERDFVDKLGVLHRAEVPHSWNLHPEEKMLLVHRWAPDGYVTILGATSGQIVRAEPFEAIEISVGELFGDDED